LRGGLKASRRGVLVYRLGANPVRWAGCPGERWLLLGVGKAAALVYEAAIWLVCRRSVRRARPGKFTLREGVG